MLKESLILLKNKFQKIKNPLKTKLLLTLILCFYVGTAHIFLPLFKKREFFFLFRWSFFSGMPQNFTYDISWDEGKTFVLRDHRTKVKNYGIRLYTLSHLLQFEQQKINHYYSAIMLKICNCNNINIIKLKGSFADHILYKKPLKIVEIKKL